VTKESPNQSWIWN